jgi:hypothetical protein
MEVLFFDGNKRNDMDDEDILNEIEKSGVYLKKLYLVNLENIISDCTLCFISNSCPNLEYFYFHNLNNEYTGNGISNSGFYFFMTTLKELKSFIFYIHIQRNHNISFTKSCISAILNKFHTPLKIELFIKVNKNEYHLDTCKIRQNLGSLFLFE